MKIQGFDDGCSDRRRDMHNSQHDITTRSIRTSMRTSMRTSIRTVVVLAAGASLAACGGGGGGSLVEESTENADAACACEEFGCTTEFIGWFNEVSITREDDLEALSAEDYDAYLANSLRAADCQDELR
jgi:hypothetical protein